MRIAVGADDLGADLKGLLARQMAESGHEIVDVNTELAPNADYPDVAVLAAQAVARGDVDRALLVCGTGIGMSIAANKVPGVRAANVGDAYSAERAVKSNNAQVLCLGSQVIGLQHARLLVEHWLNSAFAGGRSTRKVAKLIELDTAASAKPNLQS